MVIELTSREPKELSADTSASGLGGYGVKDRKGRLRRNSAKIKAKKMEENPTCYVCQNGTFYILELHHVVPISSGGADCETNTELLCPNCHAFLHFLISSRASEYIPENESLTDAISRYTDSPISKHRMISLINRWIRGVERKIELLEEEANG